MAQGRGSTAPPARCLPAKPRSAVEVGGEAAALAAGAARGGADELVVVDVAGRETELLVDRGLGRDAPGGDLLHRGAVVVPGLPDLLEHRIHRLGHQLRDVAPRRRVADGRDEHVDAVVGAVGERDHELDRRGAGVALGLVALLGEAALGVDDVEDVLGGGVELRGDAPEALHHLGRLGHGVAVRLDAGGDRELARDREQDLEDLLHWSPLGCRCRGRIPRARLIYYHPKLIWSILFLCKVKPGGAEASPGEISLQSCICHLNSQF